MTNQQNGHVLQLLRQCYRSFLLHLILSLCVTCILLLSVIGISGYLPRLSGDLTAAAVYLHRPDTAEYKAKPVLSQFVFEQAVYMLPETADRYFVIHSTSPQDPARPTAFPPGSTAAILHTEDDICHAPLEKPTLDRAAASLLPDALYQTSSDIPPGHIRILPTDLSGTAQYTESNGGILFSNRTGYRVSADPYLHAPYPIPALSVPTMTEPDGEKSDGAPLVLILHTHGTEAYAPDGAASVPRDYAYRSEDTAENVVSVGAVLAQTLEDAGIAVLHCQTMFDAASYNDSYVNAAAYIRQTVSAYPSIAYVFDVHRDALEGTDGSMLRPVTVIGAEVCAQVMSVVGTDDAGAYHPGWEDNLTVAVQLQKRLNEAYSAFTRPINLRSATFNAQYAPGSLLLEIGAAGNSVTEARSAAYHLGLVLADLIKNP